MFLIKIRLGYEFEFARIITLIVRSNGKYLIIIIEIILTITIIDVN
jgi:hypothetical protein